MLGGVSAITTVLGAAPAPDADLATLKSYARACCQVGLHLLLIEPGGKKPVDVRSPVQRRQDDGRAQDEARAAGRKDWDKVKSKSGVYLATNDEAQIIKYLERYRKNYGADTPVNFGVAVGPSKLIVVDCDTAEQVSAFLDDFGAPDWTPPTVKSPGQKDDQGQWAHSDGGHFYFTTDQVQPGYPGSITAPGGYAVLWADRYVLIPPSVRPEGPYRLVGQDFPAPPKLTGMISRTVEAKVRRSQEVSSPGVADAVDQWAAGISWDDILSPAGWTLAARPDNCGCDIWTAPGDHASPKSGTAHDSGCTLGRYTTDNAPLHIWTDNPGPELEAWISANGSKTVSRLQAVAALSYGGNVGEAMRGLEVTPDDSEALSFGRDQDRELGISKSNLDLPIPLRAGQMSVFGSDPLPYTATAAEITAAIPQGDDADPFVNAGSVASIEGPTATEAAPPKAVAGVPTIKPFRAWRDYPAPEFVIDGILEHRGFSAVIGAPGIGKSGWVLDMAASIGLGKPWLGHRTMRQPVLYLPGEGLSGAVQRLLAWEDAHGADLDEADDVILGDDVIQVSAAPEAWAAVVDKVIYYRAGLVIIDTFARASVGLEENSATDVGRAIAKFKQLQTATGAGVMVVHHTGKAGTSARGSSALNGALDTELTVEHGEWWDDPDPPPPGHRPLQVRVTKQKNAAMPQEALPGMAVPHNGSFVMTGPSGVVGDPLEEIYTPRAVIPETVVAVAIRLQEYAQRFTTQGLTRAEFAYGVPPDDYTNRRRDAKTAWRMKVNEAVDLGLRYGLLQTLTGTATGARYIPDVTTPDQARNRWAQETMID